MNLRVFLAALFFAALAHAAPPPVRWQAVANGVDYAEIDVAPSDRFHVVRIDPRRARLRAVMASALDGHPRTARQWCDEQRCSAAINLGMYGVDHLTNVGHAQAEGHVNQKRWVAAYKSVLVWRPKGNTQPMATMLDLDEPGAAERVERYQNAIQNLRLIKAPGQSVWKSQSRPWSESAVALDRDGAVLFVFAPTPHTMAEFNRILLGLPLGVVAAMHVEGGSEASLCVRGAHGLRRDLSGSYETGSGEQDSSRAQWPIPNLLAVEAVASTP